MRTTQSVKSAIDGKLGIIRALQPPCAGVEWADGTWSVEPLDDLVMLEGAAEGGLGLSSRNDGDLKELFEGFIEGLTWRLEDLEWTNDRRCG